MPDKKLKRELESFLQANPQYYPIMKSGMFIEVLNWFGEKARSMTDIKSQFMKMEEQDRKLIMNSLLGIGLIAKTSTGAKIFYYLTDKGRLLLEKQKEFSEGFKIA